MLHIVHRYDYRDQWLIVGWKSIRENSTDHFPIHIGKQFRIEIAITIEFQEVLMPPYKKFIAVWLCKSLIIPFIPPILHLRYQISVFLIQAKTTNKSPYFAIFVANTIHFSGILKRRRTTIDTIMVECTTDHLKTRCTGVHFEREGSVLITRTRGFKETNVIFLQKRTEIQICPDRRLLHENRVDITRSNDLVVRNV